MARCLILGGNGFIGSHLAEGLVKKRYDVRIFDSFQTGMMNLETIKSKVEIIKGDFLNHEDVFHALKGVDYVFHYIGTTVPATAIKDPIYDVQTNVIGAVRLLQLAVASKATRVIFPSSGGTIYGEPTNLPVSEMQPANPLDPYAISKLAIERYLHYFSREYGVDFTIFRYSNPYGERQNPYGKQGVIPIFLNKIREGEQPVIYGDGSIVRDYIYIKDAVEATIAVLEKKTTEKIFNVGSGEGTSLNELIDIMTEITGKKITPIYTKNTGTHIQKVVLNISRIRRECGWKPRTKLQDGIRKTWEWLCSCP